MSAQTDFESLKQQIVDVVTKDPAVKYILIGWMTDEFVPKTDYSKILDEIRNLREETKELRDVSNRRFEAADKRFDAVQNEIKELREETKSLREESEKRWEETNKRFEEAATERRQMREDANKRFEEMHQEMHQGFERQERYSQILAAKIDKLGGRWGIRAETAFRQGMSSIVQDLFDGEVSKWETEDTQGRVYGHTCRVELDIVISNGKCIVVEIKSRANRAEVAAFNRIVELYQQQTGVTPDRKVLIVADIDANVHELANKMGIEVFTMEEAEEQIA